MPKTRWSITLAVPLLCATTTVAEGILTSETLAGLELRNVGPANMSGRMVDVAVVESDPYTFYVATATGGLWKTGNNGVTFEPVFEREATHSIGDVAVFQKDPRIVWVGTGERANRQSSSWGDGVYKSEDAGETWTNVGLRDSHHIGRVLTHPDDPDTVYVAAMGHLWGPNEERGLYKTSDGGASWTRVLGIDADTGVVDVALDPQRPETVFAAAYQRRRRAYGFHGGGPGSGLYKSTDGGATWRELRQGLPEGDIGRIGIAVYAKDPSIVYVCVEQGLRYTASISYEQREAGIYRSTDGGDTFEHRSDWNPRPMYASQIMIDPSDPDRIYMQNSFSYSEDGGETFEVPRQSVHSDDRYVWVDPHEPRHLIKASDGALAISYDRGETWLFMAHLPVSQYYRVGVDMRDPYWIYGGLQDNGSWGGPNATYRTEGILNEDWVRIGGGDGFINLVDPADPDVVYTESQYLGLSRVDMRTRERQVIRPGNPRGFIAPRKNWTTWGRPDVAVPLLGNAMNGANWDGPFLISPHDRHTVYAGTSELYRTTDGGRSWHSLGDRTSGTDRTKLRIMGQRPTQDVPSLDDGIPYYPTISAIAESPLVRGLLYVGTDDGQLQVSGDGGGSWESLESLIPGLPQTSYVAGIEASRYDAGTVYVAFDNHRSDDFENHLYRSTDRGRTWESIASDLPSRRVVRAVHEDPRNPDLLYVGTELGFFVSIDRGGHWVELRGNLPTLAVNDFVIHPRDNDLVLGTHGRGLWILDSLTSVQQLDAAVLASKAHLFDVEPATMIRYASEKARAGDMVFKGENPPDGAIVDYFLGEASEDVELLVLDPAGERVATLDAVGRAGVNRAIWDLRYPGLTDPAGAETRPGREPPEGPKGPRVEPGTYTLRLRAHGETRESSVRVREDPRIEVGRSERRAWTSLLRELAALYEQANDLARRVVERHDAAETPDDDAREMRRVTVELRRRIQSLYGQVAGWTGAATRDQESQRDHLASVLTELSPTVQRFLDEGAP